MCVVSDGMQPRREAAKDGRRERIFDAASELIANDGLTSVSMRRLAAASGLAVNTVYALTGGRDAIVTEVARRLMADAASQFTDPPNGLDAIAQVRWLYTDGVATLLSDPVMQGLIPELLDPATSSYPLMRATTVRLVRNALQRAIDTGDLVAAVPLDAFLELQYLAYLGTLAEWSAGLLDDDQLRVRQDTQAVLGMVHLAADHRLGELRALLAELVTAAHEHPTHLDSRSSS